MIVRTYAMVAAEGRAGDLETALLNLSDKVRPMPGAVRLDVLHDQKLTGHFLFVETWKSADAAAAAGKALGREAFAPVMAALAAPPVTTQYDVH